MLALVVSASVFGAAHAARAQSSPASGETRAGRIAARQAEKAARLTPYAPGKAEVWVKKLEEQFLTGALHWHPFFVSAYSGGGFTLGAGYATHVSAYNTIDLRGSYTPSGYMRLEAEFLAPRLFDRRGCSRSSGGWREATQVGFYGTGTGNTSIDDRANYGFRQPYASATLDVRPARNWFVVSGGVEYSQWEQRPGRGHPAVGRRGLHAADVAGARAQGHLPARAGHGGHRLAHLRGLLPPRRVLRRDVPRLLRHRRRVQLPPGGLRSDPARADRAATRG